MVSASPEPPSFSARRILTVSMVLTARESSLASGPSRRNLSSSASIAASISFAVRPGRAVTVIEKTEATWREP